MLLPLHLRPRRIKKYMRQLEVVGIVAALVPSMVLVRIKEKR